MHIPKTLTPSPGTAKPQLECHDDNSSGVSSSAGKQGGFIDRTERFIVKPKYNNARVFSEGPGEFINLKGEQVIPLQFDLAREFSEGLAPVEINGKFGFIDNTGVFKIPAQLEDAFWFCDGLAAVRKGAIVLLNLE